MPQIIIPNALPLLASASAGLGADLVNFTGKTLDFGTSGQIDATTFVLNADVQIPSLNTGNNIVTTDTNGQFQESGATVETVAESGSFLNLVNFTTAPTSPTDGDAWLRVESGSTFLEYRVAGVTKSVELA